MPAGGAAEAGQVPADETGSGVQVDTGTGVDAGAIEHDLLLRQPLHGSAGGHGEALILPRGSSGAAIELGGRWRREQRVAAGFGVNPNL